MQHPDEGTIHAWLDGALSPEESHTLAEHVAGCAACAAAVAEARGLLAASSRILSALDAVPGGVIPQQAPVGGDALPLAPRAPRRGFRVARGGWRAAAAVVVLAGGAWLVTQGTRHDAARESATVVAADTSVPVASQAVASAPVPTMPAPGKGSPRAGRPGARLEVMGRGPAGGSAAGPQRESQVAAAVPPVAGTSEPAMVGDVAGALHSVVVPRASDSVAKPGAAENASVAQAPAAEKSRAAEALIDRTFESRRKLALREAPRIVLDRAYVDSVLAEDSVAAVAGRPLGRTGGDAGAAAGYSRAPAPAAAAAPMARRAQAKTDGTIASATGCWIVDTTAWSPDARRGDDAEPLLPRRVELRAERGVLGDEWNELLLRPAPGEPPFPPGTAAVWKPIGRDSYRLTIGDATRWVTATVTLEGDSLSGRARDYAGERGPIRTAELSGRRVVCRTEP